MTAVHQQTHQFACEFCMARFRGRRERNRHIADQHAAEKVSYIMTSTKRICVAYSKPSEGKREYESLTMALHFV